MSDPKQAEKAYFDAVREGQRAMADAVGAWAKSVEQLYPYAPRVPGASGETAPDGTDA